MAGRPTLAWGERNLYRLPCGTCLWGQEFQVLPSGTMFAAKSILHGLIGIAADPINDKLCEIQRDAQVIICAMKNTRIEELELYRFDLAEAFKG